MKTHRELIESVINDDSLEECFKIEERNKYAICKECPKFNDCFSCGVYEWWITTGRTPPPANR